MDSSFIHGPLALRRSKQNHVFGVKFFKPTRASPLQLTFLSQKTFCYLNVPSPLRDCVAMCCSLFDACKSPLAPLFQRGVMLWDREELELVGRNSPFFSKGIKGDFQNTLMATVRGRLSNQ